MPSSPHRSTDPRTRDLITWLDSLPPRYGMDLATLSTASTDASFRRYYRIQTHAGTVIAMDAPPSHEDNPRFIAVGDLLRGAGLNVPDVLEHDLDQGFLLLRDLGTQTYFQAVRAGMDDAQRQSLYRDALRALVRLQQAPADSLPAYDATRLLQELEAFEEWYVNRHLGLQLSPEDKTTLAQVFDVVVAHNLRAATVFVHRDYHSPNLVIHPGDDGARNPGIIDYQDAVAGPITYDIASLVMDARTTWDEATQLDWAIRYWEFARAAGLPVDADFAEFHVAYEWMSLQRNLRILGVFARLSHRDGKHHYLEHIPRVINYVRQVAQRYGPLRPLMRILDTLERQAGDATNAVAQSASAGKAV